MEKYLNDLYYDPAHPAAFGGISAIQRAVKRDQKNISVKDIKRWLSKRDTYTLHKPRRKHFNRNRVIVSGIDSQWQADLVDVSALSKYNKGHKFILTCIDVFSKFAWARPLKNKSEENVVRAFRSILKEHNRKPKTIQTDKEGEFINRAFQKFLRSLDIHFFTINNEGKAALAERFD